MRTDHTLLLNADSEAYASKLAAAIKTREEELAGLKRLHSAVLTAAEADPEPLPSFVSAGDEGFRRVAEAAGQAERRNGRPIVSTLAEQAA